VPFEKLPQLPRDATAGPRGGQGVHAARRFSPGPASMPAPRGISPEPPFRRLRPRKILDEPLRSSNPEHNYNEATFPVRKSLVCGPRVATPSGTRNRRGATLRAAGVITSLSALSIVCVVVVHRNPCGAFRTASARRGPIAASLPPDLRGFLPRPRDRNQSRAKSPHPRRTRSVGSRNCPLRPPQNNAFSEHHIFALVENHTRKSTTWTNVHQTSPRGTFWPC